MVNTISLGSRNQLLIYTVTTFLKNKAIHTSMRKVGKHLFLKSIYLNYFYFILLNYHENL